MKKFLIFLVSLVVVVCVGLTTYYFMRNNEIITIKTKEIYCNSGDVIPLKSLGINIEKANISNKTKFDYNAGGDNVTKYIRYDEASASFIVSNENGGDVTLVISTTNKKYPDFTINVHIGNGTKESPYYIFNETELNRIGSTYRLDSYYKLMNNITLTSNFKPIGYNSNTSSWEGFSGHFDGQGYSIKGMNLNGVESEKIGLFSSINAGAKVQNLSIENANIVGEYKNAGILAGSIQGSIEKIQIKNSTITNSMSNSATGSIAGVVSGNVKLTYADNVTINVSGTEENVLNNVVVGGLFGEVNQTTIQACYSNNVELNISNASKVKAGGLTAVFVIGTEQGSIQQSYSNAVCTNENFGAFIGEIVASQDFNINEANMLRHLIGNMAVVYGVENSENILDTNLVKNYDATFFKNTNNPSNPTFYDKAAALYLVRGFASAGEMITTNEFVFYAIDVNTITNWDTTYVWNTSNNSLPTLRMGLIYPELPSGEYLRRDLTEINTGDKESFDNTFEEAVKDKNIKLLEDVDLSSGWTPVEISNVTLDGNNKTITINLNKAVDNNLGLFTIIDNSTIKNLNIKVLGVSANSTNAGALAGIITSSDKLTNSTIENVNIEYVGFANPVIKNFGGIAGIIENTTINNVKVLNLNMSGNAVDEAGALVAFVNSTSKITNATIENTIVSAKYNSGIVATNNGTITNVVATINVQYKSTSAQANVAGIAGTNNGTIDNVDLTTNISIENAGQTTYVGGAVATNNGTISNIEISGEKIEILTNSNKSIYVGGIVATNNGTIENVVNNIASVGTYHVGANNIVGGIVATNNGKISKVITQSDLYGNNVSGVVAIMNNTNATIDQVVVGKFNAETKELAQNKIEADKYIAGVSVNFQKGKITNAQVASELVGKTNSTRSSLVVLIFPYGATLQNATVNSSFSGYGEKYRESWTDFASYANKAEFGLVNGETGDERFNLYKYDSFHGIMQSVVINNSNAGVSDAKAAMGAAFAFSKDYQDTAESSFIKVVSNSQFNQYSSFTGSFTFVCAKSTLLGIEHEATKTLTFSMGDVWKPTSGINLKCIYELLNIQEETYQSPNTNLR